MKIAILQIGREHLADHPGYYLGEAVPPEKYRTVWEGQVEDYLDLTEAYEEGGVEALLEAVFRRFNLDPPESFMGWSLSVGDVVRLGDQFYRCASVGFDDVTALFRP